MKPRASQKGRPSTGEGTFSALYQEGRRKRMEPGRLLTPSGMPSESFGFLSEVKDTVVPGG